MSELLKFHCLFMFIFLNKKKSETNQFFYIKKSIKMRIEFLHLFYSKKKESK